MSERQSNIDNFIEMIGYQFQDQELLQEALTHPSFSKKLSIKNYQRLEFLGDAVLGLVIASWLVKKYPNENEGHLSKRQAYLVSGEALSEIAQNLGISEVLRVSQGEESIGGKFNKRNLENALEALIGAIYLDSNLKICQEFVLSIFSNLLERNINPPKDSVSHLQEIIQGKSKKLPIYTITQTGGSSHNPIFTASLHFDDQHYEAIGSSKKEAQKNVAEIALTKIV